MLMHVYYNKAKILENSSQNMDALKEYQKILDYKTHYGKEWHKEMCGFCLNQQGDIYFGMKQKKEAIECYQKALEFNKKDAWSYYKLACLLGIDDPSVVGYLENAKDILS